MHRHLLLSCHLHTWSVELTRTTPRALGKTGPQTWIGCVFKYVLNVARAKIWEWSRHFASVLVLFRERARCTFSRRHDSIHSRLDVFSCSLALIFNWTRLACRLQVCIWTVERLNNREMAACGLRTARISKRQIQKVANSSAMPFLELVSLRAFAAQRASCEATANAHWKRVEVSFLLRRETEYLVYVLLLFAGRSGQV